MHTRALIAYAGRGITRPRYYANDHRRDLLDIAAVEMDIADARASSCTLDDAGFTLVPHRSAVADFADRAAVAPGTRRRSSRSSRRSRAPIWCW